MTRLDNEEDWVRYNKKCNPLIRSEIKKDCDHSEWFIDLDGTCSYLVETECVDGRGAKACGVKRK